MAGGRQSFGAGGYFQSAGRSAPAGLDGTENRTPQTQPGHGHRHGSLGIDGRRRRRRPDQNGPRQRRRRQRHPVPRRAGLCHGLRRRQRSPRDGPAPTDSAKTAKKWPRPCGGSAAWAAASSSTKDSKPAGRRSRKPKSASATSSSSPMPPIPRNPEIPVAPRGSHRQWRHRLCYRARHENGRGRAPARRHRGPRERAGFFSRTSQRNCRAFSPRKRSPSPDRRSSPNRRPRKARPGGSRFQAERSSGRPSVDGYNLSYLRERDSQGAGDHRRICCAAGGVWPARIGAHGGGVVSARWRAFGVDPRMAELRRLPANARPLDAGRAGAAGHGPAPPSRRHHAHARSAAR